MLLVSDALLRTAVKALERTNAVAWSEEAIVVDGVIQYLLMRTLNQNNHSKLLPAIAALDIRFRTIPEYAYGHKKYIPAHVAVLDVGSP